MKLEHPLKVHTCTQNTVQEGPILDQYLMLPHPSSGKLRERGTTVAHSKKSDKHSPGIWGNSQMSTWGEGISITRDTHQGKVNWSKRHSAVFTICTDRVAQDQYFWKEQLVIAGMLHHKKPRRISHHHHIRFLRTTSLNSTLAICSFLS